jgi:nucleoside-diphosphate-sugar epimerase
MSLVLVTGGSGFIGGHCILQCLAAGHRVRTTIRSLSREPEVRALIKRAGAEGDERLSFAAANLERDAGWPEAVAGCDFVLHVASPFPLAAPKHEDELIVPACDGALRVLKASRAASVKRVVLTSSFAAVGYGRKDQSAPFDETSWTDPNGEGVSAYAKSKTLAELAAWDFVAREGGPELSVVNPVVVFGPVLGPDVSTSIAIVQRLMDGGIPGLPRVRFGVVDVRDVADLHLRAMTDPRARGERFLAVAGDFMSMREIALTLKARLGAAARRVPTRELPDWLMRLAALAPTARQVLPELGKTRNATGAKAKSLLGWAPRSREDALVATAESLLRLGMLKEKAAA